MGRPYKFNSNTLLAKFESYKKWLKEQYFTRPELIKSGERAGEVVYIKIYSPPDILSFCLHCGISRECFYSYLDENSDEFNSELYDIALQVRDWIASEQIRGAQAGTYNPMIVARLNALKETTETSLKTETGTINIQISGVETEISD